MLDRRHHSAFGGCRDADRAGRDEHRQRDRANREHDFNAAGQIRVVNFPGGGAARITGADINGPNGARAAISGGSGVTYLLARAVFGSTEQSTWAAAACRRAE